MIAVFTQVLDPTTTAYILDLKSLSTPVFFWSVYLLLTFGLIFFLHKHELPFVLIRRFFTLDDLSRCLLYGNVEFLQCYRPFIHASFPPPRHAECRLFSLPLQPYFHGIRLVVARMLVLSLDIDQKLSTIRLSLH